MHLVFCGHLVWSLSLCLSISLSIPSRPAIGPIYSWKLIFYCHLYKCNNVTVSNLRGVIVHEVWQPDQMTFGHLVTTERRRLVAGWVDVGFRHWHIFRRQVVQRNVALRRLIVAIECRFRPKWSMTSSVTRLGNLLDFEQLFKAFATTNLPKSPTFLCNFCKGVKFFHFSSEIIFGQL